MPARADTKKAVLLVGSGGRPDQDDLEREAMSEVYPETAEKAPLSPEERAQIRAQLMSHDAGNALRFQAKAIKKYGAAGGIMCRELLFWDGMGWDPDGYIYNTKEQWQEKTGLSPKSQDGGRKRLEEAGVLEVERRPRRDHDGKIWSSSPVLHFRLDLRELFEQMTPEGATLNQGSTHADAGLRARRSGSSSKRKGVFERADQGAPYTEETTEATSDLPPQPPQGDSNGGNKEQEHLDAGEALSRLTKKQPGRTATLIEQGSWSVIADQLRGYKLGTFSEAEIALAAEAPEREKGAA